MSNNIMGHYGEITSNVENFNKEYIIKFASSKDREYKELTEEDFYPPEDNRFLQSGLNDIPNGDNFVDYESYFFETYEEELFDENNN